MISRNSHRLHQNKCDYNPEAESNLQFSDPPKCRHYKNRTNQDEVKNSLCYRHSFSPLKRKNLKCLHGQFAQTSTKKVKRQYIKKNIKYSEKQYNQQQFAKQKLQIERLRERYAQISAQNNQTQTHNKVLIKQSIAPDCKIYSSARPIQVQYVCTGPCRPINTYCSICAGKSAIAGVDKISRGSYKQKQRIQRDYSSKFAGYDRVMSQRYPYKIQQRYPLQKDSIPYAQNKAMDKLNYREMGTRANLKQENEIRKNPVNLLVDHNPQQMFSYPQKSQIPQMTPQQMNALRAQGFAPQQIAAMAAKGMSPEQASQADVNPASYARNRLNPQEMALASAGLSPQLAAGLAAKGFGPQQVGALMANGYTPQQINSYAARNMPGQQKNPYQMLPYAKNSKSPLDLAKAGVQGLTPQLMISLAQKGLSPQEMLIAGARGFPPQQMPSFGLSPQDLFTAGARGLTPQQILAQKGLSPQDMLIAGSRGFTPQQMLSLAQKGLSPQDMLIAGSRGFTPQQMLSLAQKGLNPKDMLTAGARGLTPQQLLSLAQKGLSPQDILTNAGRRQVQYPQTKQMAAFGGQGNSHQFTPSVTKGMTPQQMNALRAQGFAPQQIAAMAAKGMSPEQASQAGLNPADRASYARSQEMALASAGLSPQFAAGLAAKGLGPQQVGALMVNGYTPQQIASYASRNMPNQQLVVKGQKQQASKGQPLKNKKSQHSSKFKKQISRPKNYVSQYNEGQQPSKKKKGERNYKKTVLNRAHQDQDAQFQQIEQDDDEYEYIIVIESQQQVQQRKEKEKKKKKRSKKEASGSKNLNLMFLKQIRQTLLMKKMLRQQQMTVSADVSKRLSELSAIKTSKRVQTESEHRQQLHSLKKMAQNILTKINEIQANRSKESTPLH